MEFKATILLIDDEPKIITALKRVLKNEGYEILSATKPLDAIKIIDDKKADIIICDYNMPEMIGLDILKYCRKTVPNSARILMTGLNDINIAISAINEGSVFYFISKPWNNEEILSVVKKAFDYTISQAKKEILNNFINYKKMVSTRDLNNLNISNKENNGLASDKGRVNSVKRISVSEDDSIIILDVEDIIYIAAMGGEVYIFNKNNKYKSRDSLSSWENKLRDYNFFRCHRGYIVNISKINKVSPWFNGSYNLNLNYLKEEIPVSRNYAKQLKSILNL